MQDHLSRPSLDDTVRWILAQMSEDMKTMPPAQWSDRFVSYIIHNIRRPLAAAAVWASYTNEGDRVCWRFGDWRDEQRDLTFEIARLVDDEYEAKLQMERWFKALERKLEIQLFLPRRRSVAVNPATRASGAGA